jgi:hypothetical protein
MLLEDIIGKENIWYIEYIFVQIWNLLFFINQYDQLEGYVKANHITSSSTCTFLYVLQQQGQLQEGEQSWTASSTTSTPYANTNDFESRTTQNQEGENDEYMDVNYMVKAQSIIDSQAQEKMTSKICQKSATPISWPPPESRMTPIQVREDNEDITPTQTMHGSTTRAHAR